MCSLVAVSYGLFYAVFKIEIEVVLLYIFLESQLRKLQSDDLPGSAEADGPGQDGPGHDGGGGDGQAGSEEG